jgi:hypothetical protein
MAAGLGETPFHGRFLAKALRLARALSLGDKNKGCQAVKLSYSEPLAPNAVKPKTLKQ